MDIQADAAARASLVATIRNIADNADEDGLTLQALMERLGERAFGAALFALALPCCIPFLYIIPQIVSLPMMAFAAQMAAGRSEPWLPARFSERRIDKAGLERMARGGERFFGWAERISAPRLLFLSTPIAERIVGGVLCIFCASILTPLPSTNTVPGFAVALSSFGLMERDGLLIALGLVIGVMWVSLLVFAAVFLGTHGVSAVIEFVRGLVSGG